MSPATPRHLRERLTELRDVATKMGASFTFESNKHGKLRVTAGGRTGLVVISMTPSDHRARKNAIRDLRNTIHRLRELN